MNIADQLHYAKKLDNYAIDATTPTAFWISTTVYTAVCPAAKRWSLLGGSVLRDVSSTTTVVIKNAADETIQLLAYAAAAVGRVTFPSTLAGQTQQAVGGHGIIMDAGDYVHILFGTAQGASAEGSCVVLEVDV